MESEPNEPSEANGTKRRSHVWCGLGNVLNDVWRQTSLTFGLIFYTKVIGLSNVQAGLLMAVAQISSLLSTALSGYLCDRADVPCISRRLGRKKTWHLLSTVFLAFFLVMAFNPACSSDSSDSTSSWVKFAYFAIAYTGAAFMSGGNEIAHLSILPDMSENRDDAVVLNSLRTGFSSIAGISVYVVAWIVLGQSSQKYLTPSNWKDFTIITAVLTGTGLLFAAMFHIGTKELRERTERYIHTVFNYDGLVSVAIVFGLAVKDPPAKETGREKSKRRTGRPLYWRIMVYLVPFEVPEIPPNEDNEPNEEQGSSEDPDRSCLQQVSKYLMPYDVDSIVGPLKNLRSGKSETDDDIEDSNSNKPTEDKKRTVLVKMARYFFGLSNDHCNGDEIYINSDLDSMSTSPAMVTIVTEDETRDSVTRDTGSIDRGRHGIGAILEEEEEEEGKEEQREQGTNDKEGEVDGDEVEGDDRKQAKKKVSFETENDSPKAEESPDDVRKENVKGITAWRRWLKDPNFYKVLFIYVAVRLMETITYCYLALYITDYLHYKKEAIAYVSLIVFISALCANAVTKLLIKIAGAKWTFVLASAVVTGSAVWFYFLKESSRNETYLSALLIGCGMSGMTASALFFVIIVMSSHKQSSGFVSAFMIIVVKIVTACFIVVAQTFYPSNGQDSGAYIRYLFAVSLGIASILPAFVVIIFLRGHTSPHQKIPEPTRTERRDQTPTTWANPRHGPPRTPTRMPLDPRLLY